MLLQIETNKSWIHGQILGRFLNLRRALEKLGWSATTNFVVHQQSGTTGWFGSPMRFSIFLTCFITTGLKVKASYQAVLDC